MSQSGCLVAKWKQVRNWVSKRRVAFLVILSPVVGVFCFTFVFENYLSSWAKWLEVCFQFLTGNWPTSEGVLDHRGVVFAIGVTFKFALVYGAIAGLLKVWRDVVAWQTEELIMKYSEMLRDRDDSIENEVRDILTGAPVPQRSDLERKIHEAFTRGAKLWAEQYLPIVAGSREKAQIILDKLQTETVLR